MYKFINGMWMFQLQPSIFLTRFDGFTWLFMKSGIHQWLLNNRQGWMLADTLFYSMPLIYYLAHNRFRMAARPLALVMLLVNWVYVQCYTLYPGNSIEAHTAWLLFPLAFLASRPLTFRLLMEGLRYFFLFFMASAAVWKLYTGAVFNPDQMAGILYYQHADLLYSSPGYWQANMVAWLASHPATGYPVYLLATLLELAFVAGFFTRRYDGLLLVAFLFFLIADHLLMRIPYYEVMPFLITLRMGLKAPAPLSSAAPQQNQTRN